jgi:hypothetical protein
MSNAPLFVCRSLFAQCGTCISLRVEWVGIVHCLFQDYTTCGLAVGSTSSDGVVVEGCAFIGETAPATECYGFLTLRRTCFSRNGIAVAVPESATIGVDSGCCFRASSLSGAIPHWVNVVGDDPEFGCTSCTPGSVSFEENTCIGYEFSPRPTPLRTEAPIVPLKTIPIHSQSATQSDVPRSASREPVTEAPTPTASVPVTRTSTQHFTATLMWRVCPREIMRIGCLGLLLIF